MPAPCGFNEVCALNSQLKCPPKGRHSFPLGMPSPAEYLLLAVSFNFNLCEVFGPKRPPPLGTL